MDEDQKYVCDRRGTMGLCRDYVGACLGLSHSTRRGGEIPLKLPAPSPCALPITACVCALQPWFKPVLSQREFNSINCGIFWFFSGGPSES